MALSAFSQLLSFGPCVCIWLVARDLIAVAPNWSEACDIATYGWWAVGFALASIVVYFVGLMCTHLSAFRCASNIRKTMSEHLLKLPLGYFDTHATGELRRIVDGCAASTETLLAHMLPDIAGATAMVAGLLVLLFALDWRLGAACLISVAISLGAMATMMSGKGAEFMKAYMGALVKMNKTGTEYVRGIPVVKVFQQTVYSFKAFHDAIAEYADMAQSYAGTYEGAEAPAVSHVSFSVPAGSALALVGPSGGGKSTCASLIPRFWDVSSGRVLVGGVDVRDMDPHELMDQVAFVFQTNQLFRQTLADNVRASKPTATDDEVRAALSAAQCDDIVAKLPQGINTMLGAGGAYLSGGEVQRVALARAILKDAPIVVLDEATAFADPENEALIQRAFSKLAAGRTVIMIAHRLSTVVGADKIVVLNQGSVQETGTHAELLSQNGLYAKMWAEYEQAASWKITAAADAAVTKGGEA